jgi:amino acid adenylation domain-containing protein
MSCGAGVEDFRPGDEVIALASGAHGSQVVARSHLVVAKPPGRSFAEAASLVNAFVTAHYALRHVARVEEGERVLIHSATGGVGLAAIQMCRAAGAEIFASAGTPEKRAYLTKLGIEHVMDSRSLSFVDEVHARTGGDGVDVVLNSLAGEPMRASLELLRPYGRFVELGKRDIYENGQIDLLPFRRNLSYAAVDLMQLALDRPAFANRMIREMVEEIAAGKWEPLPLTEFDLADAQSAFRFMAQARHIGKIVLTVAGSEYSVHPAADAAPYRDDATYLITGGLGGFGLAAAEWLVARGVRSIVLMSRSGVPKDDAAALERLRESGARVVTMCGDVADEDDVARVLDVVRRDLPPLKGVLHAAMVLDDDLLERLDEERLFGVLAPKVAGAWNLHRLTATDELDFFLLFSSMASVMGHPLQGNYAAANAFLDALASYRQSLGRPALTISWGALAGVGYVSRHPAVAEYLERSGFASFTTVEAFEAMEELLVSGLPHVMAARLDWETWMTRNPSAAGSSRFSHMIVAAEPEGVAAAIGRADSPLAGFRAMAPERRPEAVREYLAQKIARVLGGDPLKVDLERPLIDLGFDSLMAVELVNALKSDLGVALPVVKILQGITGRELTAMLIEQMALDASAPGMPVKEAMVESNPRPDESDLRPVGSGSRHAEPVPLSPEQRRFWFLDRLSPANPAYNLYAAARLLGPLDERALEQSMEEVVRRHDVLRAGFESVDGEPLQVITPADSFSVTVHDLRARPPAGREAELQRLATAELREPFDLGRPPLLRASLVRLDEEEHVLLLLVHHIACDGWGITLLVREVMALYDEFRNGLAPSLPAPSARYAEYARAQAGMLTEAETAQQLEYWRNRLSGATPELSLTADHPRPATPSFRGGHVAFELPEDLSGALRELARREGVTLFALLLAAFQALLSRHGGQTDLSIGTAVATRNRSGTEDLLGCCMNTLVLRGDLSGDPSVRELLRRAKETTLEALQNQELPFERVVETIRPSRDASHSPLFRAMVVLHNLRWPELRMGRLRVHPLSMESGSSALDLTLVVDTGERLHGALEYSADLFERATAVRLVEHLRMLLREMVDDPEQRLSDLALTDGDEHRRVVGEWNDTAHDFGGPRCVHELVTAQAVRIPDAPALVASGELLTYRDVDQRARLLAMHLKQLGVGPESVVATCMAPSVDLPVALLGILRAGGAFLVLDPAYPAARLGGMLKAARAGVLIGRGRLPADLAESGATVVLLDDLEDAADPEVIGLIDGGVTPDSLAYIAFTSGSSGEPNPVMVPHRALWNQISWRQLHLPLGRDDVVLMRTPIGFDPAIWESFGPLAAGARLAVPPLGGGDASALLRCMGEHGVTTVQIVPSVLAALLDHPDLKRAGYLRRIICGGEPLPRELQESCFARLPGVELHNLYGPTETTIDATWWRCRPGDAGITAPIGRPIPNAQAHVLDEHLRPSPVGVPGEIFIGGAGVARGYLDRPELNAARFLPDRIGGRADSRLYRTGDRGRWRRDGVLEFLGRLDDQVKIRGFRVEPAEVEAVMREHPGIAEAMVIGRSDATGGHRLEAWAVGRPELTPTTAELRTHLEARLPAHMVPALLAFTDALPRLPSGKLDRRAPIADSRVESSPNGGHRPPRDALELQLISIWETFFDARPIGVTDDFFDLGGHSLLAMRLQARLGSDLGVDVPVASLLQHRTIERLARLLRDGADPSAASHVAPLRAFGSHLVPIQDNGDRPPLFFVHPAGGGVLCYLDLARCLDAEQPFYGIEARGLTAGEAPHERIEDMAADYIEAVLAARPDGPYRLGGWSLGGVVAFEMARQLEAQGRQVELVALLDAWPAAPDASAAERSEPLEAFARSIGVPTERLSTPGRAFRELPVNEQLSVLLEHARATDLVPSDADPEELRRRLQLFAAHLGAMREYTPGPYTGEVTLFRAVEEANGDVVEPGGAWTNLAGGGVTVHSVPGTHHTVLRDAGVRIIARELTARLARIPAISV